MDEDDYQAGGGAPPPPRPRQAAPKTIRIQSSNPIPPGRVDVAPTSRSGRFDLDPRMMAIVGIAAVVLLIVVGVFLAAGDDDEQEPSAAKAAPAVDAKDRFVARGDALCRRANRQGERLLFPDSPEQFPSYLDDVRSIAVNLITDLKNLRRPQEDRRLLRRLFSKLDRLPPLLSQAQAAAAAGDVGEVDRRLTRAETIEHQANALALQYGFVDCSEP